MIVRDEAAVIERCLESVRDLIDSWAICDTGSCDGTQRLVEKMLEGVPGRLHERQWRDFGHNRTELMRLAAGRGDYLLLIDADMTVTFDRAKLTSLHADAYRLRHAGPTEYWVKRLVRGDRNWRYVGATHEYLTCGTPEAVENLDAIVVHHHADSGTRAEKFQRDLRLLTKELEHKPDNARAVFYMAQTHCGLDDYAEAINHYEQRARMGGWDEEVFYSMFQVGVLEAKHGGWSAARAALIRAWEYRPARLEPLYELVSRLRVRGEYQAAHEFVQHGLGRRQPDDIVAVSPWIYRWGLLFEYSITSYWVGEHQAALAACQHLLTVPDLPDVYRQQTIKNRDYCLRRIVADQRQSILTSPDRNIQPLSTSP
jgi:tetratricopeptide (TPR) repeat protein